MIFRIGGKIMLSQIRKNKKGFTLIEMLVVIAIIAVLVAIIIPTVMSSTDKAAASTDAANLRNVLGQMNAVMLMNEAEIEEAVKTFDAPESELYPGAELHVLHTVPGVIDVYYVLDGKYYGMDYFSDYAKNNSSDVSTDKPTTAGNWYIIDMGD